MSPRISVITPCWNRGSLLKRVWDSLAQQTYTNFEWIVGNDGSTDNTNELVALLAHQSSFPVTLVTSSCRVGKSRIDNEAVKVCKGEFIIWCDSDDCFTSNALEFLINTWDSIPCDQQNQFCGVTALCDTSEGVLGEKFYEQLSQVDLTWNKMYSLLQSDHVIFTRSDLVKAHPYPEVDFLIPESSVWSQIGVLKTRFCSVILERKQYGAINCLSYSGYMAYNRGKAVSASITRKYSASSQKREQGFMFTVNFIRYAIHGDISIFKAVYLWQPLGFEWLKIISAVPFATLLALKDMMQGKVQKTHLEFEVAKRKAVISVRVLNHN